MSEALPVKHYEVTDLTGTVHRIDANFMFNNAGELVFRLGERGASDVIALFAAGQWMNLVMKAPAEVTE